MKHSGVRGVGALWPLMSKVSPDIYYSKKATGLICSRGWCLVSASWLTDNNKRCGGAGSQQRHRNGSRTSDRWDCWAKVSLRKLKI